MNLQDLIGLEAFVVISLVLKSIGFTIRDELTLRVLVVMGICFDVAFYALQPVPILPPILSSMILISINVVILTLVIRERTTISMTPREKALFEAFGNLTPGQFRKLLKICEMGVTDAPREILFEGQVPDRLFYIEGERFGISKGDFRADVPGPAFAGEIAFLTGAAASATVILPEGTPYSAWPVLQLHQITSKNISLKNALTARFSLDLAAKVAASMPMPAKQAAKVAPSAAQAALRTRLREPETGLQASAGTAVRRRLFRLRPAHYPVPEKARVRLN